MSVSLRKLSQIALTVHDLDRSVAFYRDILGMPFLFRVPNLAFFDCGGVRVMLGKPEKPEQDHPGSFLYFAVDDIHEAWGELVGHGVTVVSPPHIVAPLGDKDLWMAFFEDPDRNPLVLTAEVPRT